MIVTRKSMFSGVVRSKELDVTLGELARWADGMIAPTAMPRLDKTEREFVMTGVTDEEWSAEFNDDEEAA